MIKDGKILTPECYESLLYPKRIKVRFGGRGAGKSEDFAEKAVAYAYQNGSRWLCAREFQNSIDDSVYSLIVSKIRTMEEQGIIPEGFFQILSTEILGKNGSCFRFIGLARNITSIKSKHGYTHVWIEEAETVTNKTWELLEPSIRAENSEIWISFNPDEETSATYVRYVKPYLPQLLQHGKYEDDDVDIRKVGWQDNPWFPDVLRKQMERDKAVNYKRYLHIWEGECSADYDDSIIEPEWVDAAVDAHLKLNYKAKGERILAFDPADTGKDPKAICMRHGALIVNAVQKKDGDLDDAIAWAFDSAFEFRSQELIYDGDGLGAGVKVGLKDRIAGMNMDVTAFKGGESPDSGMYGENQLNEDIFRNKRAQYWWLLRDRFEKTYRAVVKGEYFNPQEMIFLSSDIKDLSLLKAELVRQQRKRSSGSRLIQLISKDEMRAKGIPSPNMADALMMSFAIKQKKKQQNIVAIPTTSFFK